MASITAVLSPTRDVDTGRLSAEMIPVVTVPARPSGEPMAMTSCPTARFSTPMVIGCRDGLFFTCSTAMSEIGSARAVWPGLANRPGKSR